MKSFVLRQKYYLCVYKSERLEAEKAILEERCEDKIRNLQKHLKRFYSEELKVRTKTECTCHCIRLVPLLYFDLCVCVSFCQERDQEIEALSAALEKQKVDSTSVSHELCEGLRRSKRLTGQSDVNKLRSELDQCRSELDQCRAELFTKTEGTMEHLCPNNYRGT